MKKLAMGVLVLWLAALTGWLWHERAQRLHSPFEPYCETAADGAPQCAISLAALAFEPMAAEGQRIASRGVLVLDRGFLALYSSEAAFATGDRRQALRVRVPAAEQQKLVEEFRGMVVVFRGRVVASDTEALQLGFMGTIAGLEHVEPASLPDPGVDVD